MNNYPNGLSTSRRDFLRTSGALVVSMATPASMSVALAQVGAGMPITAGKPALDPNNLDSWLAILPNGRVHAFFGKMDMGQSLDIAIAQIVAEELDVAVDRVDVLMGDTATSFNQGGASGSYGVSAGGQPLRLAAAEARRLLVDRAATKLGVSTKELSVADGVVSVTGAATRKVTYTELLGGQYFHHKVEWNKQVGNFANIKVAATPKKPEEYKIVGQSLPRRDVEEKVFGTADFVTDIKLPNMLHGRVIRPPRAACHALSIDEASIKSIPGARVIREKEFIAVVADNEWNAVRAAQALEIEWAPTGDVFPGHEKLHDYIRAAKVVQRTEQVKEGDVEAVFKTAARVIEAEYEWPLQSHASMGPGCAVADVRADGATVWTGSQKPHYVRDGVAKMLKLPADSVRAIWVYGAGSYGRNDAGDAASDAALCSKLTGRPVRVQYMREQGTAWDPKGPAMVERARAALDAQGNVIAYDFTAKGFSRIHISTNEADPGDSLAGQELGWALKPGIGLGIPSESYNFANKRLAWEVIAPLVDKCSPLRTAHLRDPVGPEIHFASEQFIDEIAAATGVDPLEFRLKNVKNPRHKALLEAVAKRANWTPRVAPKGPRSGDLLTGRGVAYSDRNGTCVAIVADVEVDRRTGRVWGRRFTVAHDCGLIINPQGVRYTIEGNIVQGLSRVLFEEVKFDRTSVTSVDWIGYPILEMADAPESIAIELINRPNIAPSGAGEPSIRPLPAAVANAFFDATGVRMRKAPLTPERVKAALAKA